MKIEELYTNYKQSNGICTDTRNITQNCIFFALKGDNFNGNIFAEEALEKGAFKVVVDETHFNKNDNILLVDDSLTSLQKLATHHREELGIPIIALTGSNGKTTTKELINAVLSKKYKTTATKGNLNNHIGVPLTLLSMNANTEIGIVEMGANHLKEIELLSRIANPNYGYITNFGKAHIEGFGSLEGVIQGKTELYTQVKKTNGVLFVNSNDQKQIDKSKGLNKVTFGTQTSDCFIEFVNASEVVIAKYKDSKIKSNLIGNYNYANIAAAIAIGDYFKVSEKNIKAAIESYVPTNNRSQLLQKNGHSIILDAYNANPTSMSAALKNFKQTKGTNKIAILGDMFELGDYAKIEHQAIAELVSSLNFNTVYLVGENFSEIQIKNSNIYKYLTFELFKKAFNPAGSATILIKGSRGMELERTLDLL